MIFKSPEGQFDWPALVVCLFMAFSIVGVIAVIVRALKNARVWFSWTSTYGDPIEFHIDRKSNPFKFWLLILVYAVGIFACIAMILGLSTGYFRK